jgi:ABC-type sugar transport system permease subunit
VRALSNSGLVVPVASRPSRRGRPISPLAVGTALFLIVFYGVIFVIPFATSIWLSFQNWDFIVDPKFVGTRNFDHALRDPYFWQALKTTVFFSVVEIATGVTIATMVAILLSRLWEHLQRFFLGLIYLPVITPGVVSILLWRWLYQPNGGAFNTFLHTFGIPEQPFLNSPDQALWCVTAMVVWQYLGIGVIIFLAGINDIPSHLFEAAMLDGAGFWQQAWHLILPLLKPVLYYQMIVSVIGTVQMFEQFYLMPGPGFSTRTLSVYTYSLGFQTLNLGYGAAVSIIIFLMLLWATIVQLRYYRIGWRY